jgi:hypothetical protein
MNRISVVIFFLFFAASVWAQSRNDIPIYLMPTSGGTADERAFFDKNFLMELESAQYKTVESERECDYIFEPTVLAEDRNGEYRVSTGSESAGTGKQLQLKILKNDATRSELLQLSQAFVEKEDMYTWNLYLIFQAMANIPLPPKIEPLPSVQEEAPQTAAGSVKRTGVFFEVEYSPIVPVFGDFADQRDIVSEILPLAPSLRFGVIFFNGPGGSLGIELNTFWSFFSVSLSQKTVSTHIGAALLSVLYFFPLPSPLYFGIRAGGGMTAVLLTAANGEPTSRLYGQDYFLTISGGLCFRVIVYKNFFAEVNLDAVFHPTAVTTPTGYICPALGMGLRL